MTGDFQTEFDEELEELIEQYFHKIDACYNTDPDKALGLLMQATIAINIPIASTRIKKPRLIEKLDKHMIKLKQYLSKIAKKSNALTYSISVGIPSGITITATWKI